MLAAASLGEDAGLLDLLVEAAQGAFERLVLTHSDFCQSRIHPLGPIVSSTEKGVLSSCPTCEFSNLEIAVTQLSKSQSLAVNYLRREGCEGVLVPSWFLWRGLESGVKSAGITTEIKAVSGGLESEGGLEKLANGEELMAGGSLFPTIEQGWYLVDAAARYFVGLPTTASEAPADPWIVTKESAPAEPEPAVKDFRQQFEKLWSGAH